MICECEEVLKGYRAHGGQVLMAEMLKKAFLRDWFAGMAMQGDIASSEGAIGELKLLAEWSYMVADAMMEARKIVVELSDETDQA